MWRASTKDQGAEIKADHEVAANHMNLRGKYNRIEEDVFQK
jgi:hypothetical protein